MKYIIDESLANSILDYLVRRPYIEVANLVQSIHLLKPVEIIDEKAKAEKTNNSTAEKTK